MTIVASAPGKIVLAGEYAVLFGAPAICMAVDRRAVVGLQPNAEGNCTVLSPGFAGEDRFRVVDAVCPAGRPPFDIEFDTVAFAENGNKIGIGSSAALTVALTAALAGSADVFNEALLAHQRLQGNAGSGVDIAAAVNGGLLQYRMKPGSTDRLAWPEGLAMRVIWTGVSASTEVKLHKLQARPPSRSRMGLEEAASLMAEKWLAGKVDDILGAYTVYIETLRAFSIDHDLGIFDAGHEELRDAALADELVYKPAGAGGGDIGVLFGRNDDALDGFIARRRALIHGVVACDLDPDGVRLEQM